MKESFAIVATILAIAGNVPYVIGILKGTVRPHAYTWFVWSVVSAIVFLGQVARGAGIGALPTLAAEIFTILNFLLALKYGYRDVTTADTVFLCIALTAIVPWLLTEDPTVSVIIAVSIDVIAFLPTLRKAWLEPKTEHGALYVTNVLRHVLALFALEAYNIATTLHSIAMITTNTTMTLILFLRKVLRFGVHPTVVEK